MKRGTGEQMERNSEPLSLLRASAERQESINETLNVKQKKKENDDSDISHFCNEFRLCGSSETRRFRDLRLQRYAGAWSFDPSNAFLHSTFIRRQVSPFVHHR